jgi:hypothetical protein
MLLPRLDVMPEFADYKESAAPLVRLFLGFWSRCKARAKTTF